jgi:hypothetical protein
MIAVQDRFRGVEGGWIHPFNQGDMHMRPIQISKTIFLSLAILVFTSCGGKTPTPGQVANAIIVCTETACTAQPTSPSCTKLAGIPDLVAVGYADVACIVADLATASNSPRITANPTAQQNAATWLKAQRITVNK